MVLFLMCLVANSLPFSTDDVPMAWMTCFAFASGRGRSRSATNQDDMRPVAAWGQSATSARLNKATMDLLMMPQRHVGMSLLAMAICVMRTQSLNDTKMSIEQRQDIVLRWGLLRVKRRGVVGGTVSK